MKKFMFLGIEITIVETRYTNGNLAIQLIDFDGPFCTLSTNVDSSEINEDEFAVKNWSENAEVASAALDSGHFIDTGRRIGTGIPVWRLKQP